MRLKRDKSNEKIQQYYNHDNSQLLQLQFENLAGMLLP